MEPLREITLPRFPAQPGTWQQQAKWWQLAVQEIEKAVKSINLTIVDIVAAQSAADAAQDDAISALQEAVEAGLAAASAQNTADGAVQQDVGPAWDVPTGTAARATFASYTGQTISNPPTQAEVQAHDVHLVMLSQRMAAMVSDLKANGALT